MTRRVLRTVQQGFTLIELVIVLVILGILAAVAVPKYVDLTSSANKASLQSIAGAITSASAINYAACATNGSTSSTCIALSSATACNSAAMKTYLGNSADATPNGILSTPLTFGAATGQYVLGGTAQVLPASGGAGASITNCTISQTGNTAGSQPIVLIATST